ncbi:substrate-binding domain-containing protein [Oryzibacter oryziterrae]|uniref:substrate-binding domain-containing protein n=1 Tax=Oryzibacter oryziterrae TaxID=2766474 RepID=UPI001F417C92|nr:substrate-binding domain-containing protein [Oryzibacter oryziterrae]
MNVSDLSRRNFLKTSSALGLGGLMAGTFVLRANAAPGVIDVIINSDTNILDFWTQVIKPGFEAANAGVTLNLVSSGGGAATDLLAERAFAALQTKTDPQVDFLEAYGPYHPADAISAGLWTDFPKAGLANYANINPVTVRNEWSLPYRGSQVVMFYNGDKIPNPPKSFPELIEWIKANPGEFAYARPDKGDSGACFIERALQEVTGKNPDLFKGDNYSESYAKPFYDKLWPLLKDIAPSLYKGGEYTAGNTPSIQLLASGAISMTIAWSDMALTAINEGVVPESTRLAQLGDLAFTGGFSTIVIPKSAANYALAVKLADFIISPEIQNKIVTGLGGFPSLKWDAMDPALAAKYAAAAPTSIPEFPGTWEPSLFDGWYREVAANLARD